MNTNNSLKSLLLLRELHNKNIVKDKKQGKNKGNNKDKNNRKTPLLQLISLTEPNIMQFLYNLFCKNKSTAYALKKKKALQAKLLRKKYVKHYRKSLRLLQQGPKSILNIVGEF